MCKIMDDTIKDVLKEDRLERDQETAKRLIALGKLSCEEISKAFNLPLSTVEQLAQSMIKA